MRKKKHKHLTILCVHLKRGTKMSKRPYIGELDHRITIFHIDPDAKTSTGETIKEEIEIGEISAKREDNGGNETEDEKIFYLQNRVYTIRYVQCIHLNGEEMFVRDNDGDYQIYSVEVIGRNEFLKIKTTKRE